MTWRILRVCCNSQFDSLTGRCIKCGQVTATELLCTPEEICARLIRWHEDGNGYGGDSDALDEIVQAAREAIGAYP